MAEDPQLLESMRRDWNARAREDANYYVAFGRRGQDDTEFFATAEDLMRYMREEVQRLPAASRRAALEIGCGPGRLMRPASELFREIHGIDVSDEMVRLAAEKLRDIPHACVHSTNGSNLSIFDNDTFDFIYSYAVFQHIPSREVVFEYLSEARRVLRPGGILWCQLNGLPPRSTPYTTWEGARIGAEEVAAFARANDFQLLRLEGAGTQYLWISCRKQMTGWKTWLEQTEWTGLARLRHIHNAYSGESATPSSGRFAVSALAIEDLPQDCDLNHLEVRIDGRSGAVSYIGPPHWDGVCQVNVALPENTRTGIVPVEVDWIGAPLCRPGRMHVIPPGPMVPRICSLTDGVDLLAAGRISSGLVKVTMEEVATPELFRAAMDGKPVLEKQYFCTDPRARRFEINFPLPEATAAGPHRVEVWLGRRSFAPIGIEVA